MFAQWDDGGAGARGKYDGSLYDDSSAVFAVKPGKRGRYASYKNCGFKMSGNEAEFAWLKVDVREHFDQYLYQYYKFSHR